MKLKKVDLLISVPDSSRQFPTVPDSSRQFPTVPDSSRQFPTVPDSSRQFQTVPDSSRQFPTVPGTSQAKSLRPFQVRVKATNRQKIAPKMVHFLLFRWVARISLRFFRACYFFSLFLELNNNKMSQWFTLHLNKMTQYIFKKWPRTFC